MLFIMTRLKEVMFDFSFVLNKKIIIFHKMNY